MSGLKSRASRVGRRPLTSGMHHWSEWLGFLTKPKANHGQPNAVIPDEPPKMSLWCMGRVDNPDGTLARPLLCGLEVVGVRRLSHYSEATLILYSHTRTKTSTVRKIQQTRVLVGVPLSRIAARHAGVSLSGRAAWVKVCSLLMSGFLTTTQHKAMPHQLQSHQ